MLCYRQYGQKKILTFKVNCSKFDLGDYKMSTKRFYSFLCQGLVKVQGKKMNSMCHGLAVSESTFYADNFARDMFRQQYGCEPDAVSVIPYEVEQVLSFLED